MIILTEIWEPSWYDKMFPYGSIQGQLLFIVVMGFFVYLLMKSYNKDIDKRNAQIQSGMKLRPRNHNEYEQFCKIWVEKFKHDYPNYHEAFTDKQVEEIIGQYVCLGKFGQQKFYDIMVAQGKIDKEWFDIITEYCVLPFADDK